MNMNKRGTLAFLLALGLAGGSMAQSREPVRIGFIGEMSGPFADFGMQMLTGIKTYMQKHGDTVQGRKVEILVRDVGGPNPELSRRLAQELLVRDKVHFLAGFGFSPNALSAAAVADQAKRPMVVMNAAATQIPARSPYVVRTSMTTAHTAAGTAVWALQNGVRKAYSIVIDYAPGHDAETAFVETFKAGGGEIVGTVRVPLNSVEFSPHLLRVRDARPDALFSFINAGNPGVAFFKAAQQRGLSEAGIKMIGTGDTVFETILEAAGDAALGFISVYPYSAAHPSPENREFVQAFSKLAPSGEVPTIMGVSGYDGMAAIYEAVRKVGDLEDGTKLVDALKGQRINSPRGPISISPVTGDIVQDLYARKTERRGNVIENVEFGKITVPQR